MPVGKPHISDRGVYFITFTNHEWIPLFAIADSYDLVYKWFDYLTSKQHSIVGYVIMPNHVHLLLHYHNNEHSLNTLVSNGKRFIAYGIIQKLKDANRFDILTQLSNDVSVEEGKKGQHHKVFKRSFDVKLCHDFKFVNQKLQYIHANPLSKKWALCESEVTYEHSSARFYETGEHAGYSVVHYMELL